MAFITNLTIPDTSSETELLVTVDMVQLNNELADTISSLMLAKCFKDIVSYNGYTDTINSLAIPTGLNSNVKDVYNFAGAEHLQKSIENDFIAGCEISIVELKDKAIAILKELFNSLKLTIKRLSLKVIDYFAVVERTYEKTKRAVDGRRVSYDASENMSTSKMLSLFADSQTHLTTIQKTIGVNVTELYPPMLTQIWGMHAVGLVKTELISLGKLIKHYTNTLPSRLDSTLKALEILADKSDPEKFKAEIAKAKSDNTQAIKALHALISCYFKMVAIYTFVCSQLVIRVKQIYS